MALFHTTDTTVLDLFEESGSNVSRAALLLRDLLVDYPERPELAREILACEHEGDRIAHDIIHRLTRAGPARQRPGPAGAGRRPPAGHGARRHRRLRRAGGR